MIKNKIKRFENFLNSVLYYNRTLGFKLKIGPEFENYCWESKKEIHITYNGTEIDDYIKEMILHEIAHIGQARFCNNKHCKSFWKHYDQLKYKFLRHFPESPWQKNKRDSYINVGFFNKNYESK